MAVIRGGPARAASLFEAAAAREDARATMLREGRAGLLSGVELQALMAQLGQEKKLEDISKMLDEVDADGSGEIEVEEFLVLMVNYVGPQGEALQGGQELQGRLPLSLLLASRCC